MTTESPNAGKRRCWIIISYFSSVDGLACSHHVDDRITELQMLGIEPVVVSSCGCPQNTDYRKLRTFSPAPSGLRFEMRHIARRTLPNTFMRRILQIPFTATILPAYILEKCFLNLDSTWSWFLTAWLAAFTAARKHCAELIYSTGGPASAHIAAYICARLTKLPWIAEYQDPIAGHEIPRSKVERLLMPRLEKVIGSHADAVVFVTKTACEEALKRVPIEGRSHVIYPGSPQGIFERITHPPKSTKSFFVGHFGSLSGSRRITPVLDALAEIAGRNQHFRNTVKLILVGNMDSAQKKALNDFPFPHMIEHREKISRTDALKQMMECHLLLLVQNQVAYSTVTIPSKVYEYMASGVPILGLTYANNELSEMLTRMGHLACDLRDSPSLRSLLEKAYDSWRAGQPIAKPILPSPYTTTSAAQKLLAISDTLIENARDRRNT